MSSPAPGFRVLLVAMACGRDPVATIRLLRAEALSSTGFGDLLDLGWSGSVEDRSGGWEARAVRVCHGGVSRPGGVGVAWSRWYSAWIGRPPVGSYSSSTSR